MDCSHDVHLYSNLAASSLKKAGSQDEDEDEDEEEEEPAEEYRVGDEVEGKYKNGRWYPATVKAVQEDGTFLLDWDDSDPEDRVKSARQLRKVQVAPDIFPVGIEIKGAPLSSLRNRYEIGHIEFSESKMKKIVYVIQRITDDAVNKQKIVEASTKPNEFRVGDKVDGRYKNNRWYPAVIAEKKPDGSFVLNWDDNDSQDRVKSAKDLRHQVWEKLGRYDFLLLSVQKFNYDDEEVMPGGVTSAHKVKQVWIKVAPHFGFITSSLTIH